MLGPLLRRLAAPAGNRSASPGEGRAALAALLVQVARADGRYGPEERAGIEALFMRRHGLSAAAAAALRAEGEAREAAAADTVRFTRALKEAVPPEDRDAILEALWEVALADGRRAPEEDAKLRLVASLLGVTDRDSALARQRVEARRA